jgi:hypothetical protein
MNDRLCGLVVRVPGYRSRGPGSIPGATRFSEKQWVWNGVYSAMTSRSLGRYSSVADTSDFCNEWNSFIVSTLAVTELFHESNLMD